MMHETALVQYWSLEYIIVVVPTDDVLVSRIVQSILCLI